MRGRKRDYYYFQRHRGTAYEGPRHAVLSAPGTGAFLSEVEKLAARSTGDVDYPEGSVGWLVAQYRRSPEFGQLSDSTRAGYEVHMRRLENPEGWGLLSAAGLKASAVMAARDLMTGTPVMANLMLSFGATLWNWSIPLDYVEHNPFEKVPNLEVPDRGHVPWPAWTQAFVIDSAPPDLVRMVLLARATAQRESDFVRMGPEQRDRSGIWCRPKKTRKKRRTFLIPLRTTDALMLDRWAEEPMHFKPLRFKKPVERHRADVYLYSPKGSAYNPSSLRQRWRRWLRTGDGRKLSAKWQEWLTQQVRRYEWDINPEDVEAPTIHGLRGAGILLRRAEGFTDDQIASDVGMNIQTVKRYTRFIDQIEAGEDHRTRLTVVQSADP